MERKGASVLCASHRRNDDVYGHVYCRGYDFRSAVCQCGCAFRHQYRLPGYQPYSRAWDDARCGRKCCYFPEYGGGRASKSKRGVYPARYHRHNRRQLYFAAGNPEKRCGNLHARRQRPALCLLQGLPAGAVRIRSGKCAANAVFQPVCYRRKAGPRPGAIRSFGRGQYRAGLHFYRTLRPGHPGRGSGHGLRLSDPCVRWAGLFCAKQGSAVLYKARHSVGSDKAGSDRGKLLKRLFRTGKPAGDSHHYISV